MKAMLTCNRCGTNKDPSLFYIRTENGRRKQPCKACIASRAKAYRKSRASDIAKRNRQWAKANADHIRAYRREYTKTPQGAWVHFKSKRKKAKHQVRIGKDAFIRWYSAQEKRCHYCGLTADEANEILGHLTNDARPYNLQFDRLSSELGYEEGNIALACKVCNDHKKEVFTEAEFLKIAAKHLGKKLLLRLRLEREHNKSGKA